MPSDEPKDDEPKEGQTPVSVCNKSCEQRISRVKELTDFYNKRYSMERFCSLVFSVIGVVLMIICTMFVIFGSKLDKASVGILAGSILGGGGFISLGIASLFRFMDKVDDSVTEKL